MRRPLYSRRRFIPCFTPTAVYCRPICFMSAKRRFKVRFFNACDNTVYYLFIIFRLVRQRLDRVLPKVVAVCGGKERGILQFDCYRALFAIKQRKKAQKK